MTTMNDMNSPENIKAILLGNLSDYRQMIRMSPEAAEMGVITKDQADTLVGKSFELYRLPRINPRYAALEQQMTDIINA